MVELTISQIKCIQAAKGKRGKELQQLMHLPISFAEMAAYKGWPANWTTKTRLQSVDRGLRLLGEELPKRPRSDWKYRPKAPRVPHPSQVDTRQTATEIAIQAIRRALADGKRPGPSLLDQVPLQDRMVLQKQYGIAA